MHNRRVQARQQRARLVGLAGISAGVAFIAIYSVSPGHALYELLVGVACVALGALNLAMSARRL